ncbi:MAG TPA: acyl-CoA reductase [Bacteroidales bacterium]|nr:acyl-CoA reductase [Bacteroidales bacterium]HPS17356.1 acyl-CoA reductase [Bacteroidales bacterium]
MSNTENSLTAFIKLGEKINKLVENGGDESFDEIIRKSYKQNNWFIRENILFALRSIALMLSEEKLRQWLAAYKFPDTKNQNPKNILVVSAGNIPLVGFHDFLSVLISGNNYVGKLSSDDNILLPAIAEMLISTEASFAEHIHFTEGKAQDFDAAIATGSDNTSRYFDYYFGKYPNIIRRNRNSIAILTGQESESELSGLADDICMYFGLGCRNVSKVFIPEDSDISIIFTALQKYRNSLSMHNKYMNNYDYHKSIFMMNQTKYIDNDFMLFTENAALSSPIAIVNYQRYKNTEEVKKYIADEKDKLQCVIGNENIFNNGYPFGKSQQPELWDYADGVDTLAFLLKLFTCSSSF